MKASLSGRIVGPISTDTFFESFLCPKARLPALRRVPKKMFEGITTKVTSYSELLRHEFARSVNGSFFSPNFLLVERQEEYEKLSTIESRMIRPSLCVFPKDSSDDHARKWASLEFFVDVCSGGFPDPFTFLHEASGPWTTGADYNRPYFKKLTTFLNAQFSRQHRTFIFVLCVFGRHVRLLRVDRAGIVVSDAGDYVSNPRIIAEFFWRYNHLSTGERGFDPTAVPATTQERELLNRAYQEYCGLCRDRYARPVPRGRRIFFRDYPAYKIQLTDHLSGGIHHYIIRGFFAGGESLFGRATRGYLALSVDEADDGNEDVDKPLCSGLRFLKDSWRADGYGMEREADVYDELKKYGIPNIPAVLCAGDVHCDGEPEQTITDSFKQTLSSQYTKHAHKVRPTLIHHRVVQELVWPMSAVDNAKELVQAMRDVLESIIEAYFEIGRLHCDLSCRNVMISNLKQGSITRGYLNDWDMSATLSDDDTTGYRSGTWNFWSIAMLQDSRKSNEVTDDLESLYWVLLCIAMKHFKHSKRLDLSMFYEQNQENLAHSGASTKSVGGVKKEQFIKETRDWHFLCPALDDLITDLTNFWKTFYESDEVYHQLQDNPSQLFDFFDRALQRDDEAWSNGERIDDQYGRKGSDQREWATRISCDPLPRAIQVDQPDPEDIEDDSDMLAGGIRLPFPFIVGKGQEVYGPFGDWWQREGGALTPITSFEMSSCRSSTVPPPKESSPDTGEVNEKKAGHSEVVAVPPRVRPKKPATAKRKRQEEEAPQKAAGCAQKRAKRTEGPTKGKAKDKKAVKPQPSRPCPSPGTRRSKRLAGKDID
ncbi:hypothetical protein K474DRAFT_725682 [Panus rudis PR-1116 ss-1]|nr:hypothetical protein K474DRAFT_725682 [Panus rudis PR-1116 ss-1]